MLMTTTHDGLNTKSKKYKNAECVNYLSLPPVGHIKAPQIFRRSLTIVGYRNLLLFLSYFNSVVVLLHLTLYIYTRNQHRIEAHTRPRHIHDMAILPGVEPRIF